MDTWSWLAEVRLLVGFLGEKDQYGWWGSAFLGSASEAFLTPIFPRTTMLARYHGVSEAAMLIHDEVIGVGASFHLYRLPDAVERAVAEEITKTDARELMGSTLSSRESALKRLEELAPKQVEKTEGPAIVGDYSDAKLRDLLQQSAGHYLQAFLDDYKCFPFMREAG